MRTRKDGFFSDPEREPFYLTLRDRNSGEKTTWCLSRSDMAKLVRRGEVLLRVEKRRRSKSKRR